MTAIKYLPKLGQYVVYGGVMKEYAKFNPDGTFSGSAGISVYALSRKFDTLEEAQEAKAAHEEWEKKYR